MRIATWNVERLKHHKDLDKIIDACQQVRADVLVLTETDNRVALHYKYCYQTPLLAEYNPQYYATTENRVSIFTNYKCIRQHETYDKYTAICTELETERGSLLVYGTIMGIFGNREKSFNLDIEKQMEDIKRLASGGADICVIGDYNLTFCDNYYYTKYGRKLLQSTFAQCNMEIVTQNRKECIDHIALSNKYIKGRAISIDEWNDEKSLSDHKGIVIESV